MANNKNMRILAEFVVEHYDSIESCDKCTLGNNWLQGIGCEGCMYNGGQYSNFAEPPAISIAHAVLKSRDDDNA